MMTQPETTTPEHALQAAAEHLSELRLRIGAGDPTVTADDLDRAERIERYARTRIEMAGVAAARDREADRLARIDGVRARLPQVFEHTKLDKARGRLEAALSAYMAEAAGFNAGASEVWDALIRAGELPAGVQITTSGIEDQGTSYRQVDAQLEVARVAQASFQAHFPGHPVRAFRTEG